MCIRISHNILSCIYVCEIQKKQRKNSVLSFTPYSARLVTDIQHTLDMWELAHVGTRVGMRKKTTVL